MKHLVTIFAELINLTLLTALLAFIICLLYPDHGCDMVDAVLDYLGAPK